MLGCLMMTARFRVPVLVALCAAMVSCGGDDGVGESPAPTVPATRLCNALSFGAIGDGRTDNTLAIQAAIDSCAAQGGGRVTLVAGTGDVVYVTGPIVLRSHVYLFIDSGVTLQSTNDHSRFVPAFINWVYRPGEALVSASGATDVGILGEGAIDGASGTPDPADGGRSWLDVGQAEDTITIRSRRPWVIEFYKCDNITVSGITIRNQPYWTQVYRFSSNLTITGVKVDGMGRNSDGLDLVGVTNATISNLDLRDSDDFIAIKSGRPIDPADFDYELEKDLPRIASSNIRISNVVGRDGQGISIGSEAINGVHDVTFENIELWNSRGGFRIKSGRDRGAEIFNIQVKNFVMHGGGWPIIVDMYYSEVGPDPRGGTSQPITSRTPRVHDISIRDVVATNTGGQSYIHGLPESCVRNITLENVKIDTPAPGIELLHMTGAFTNVNSSTPPPFVVLENVTVATAGTTPVIVATAPLAGQSPCN
jgi:polygalacturonase